MKKSRQIPDKQIDTPDAPDATVAGFDPTPGFVSAAASISGSDEIDIDVDVTSRHSLTSRS